MVVKSQIRNRTNIDNSDDDDDDDDDVNNTNLCLGFQKFFLSSTVNVPFCVENITSFM